MPVIQISLRTTIVLRTSSLNKEHQLMSKIDLKVNGQSHSVDVDPATPLLYVLRNDLVPSPGILGQGRDHHARRARRQRAAASAAAGLDRRASAAMRLLPERPDHDRESAAG
jgi:hypothetical protein